MTTTKSDFATAEEIKTLLAERDKVEQERIIRWVNESLGLTTISSPCLGVGGQTPVAPQVPATVPPSGAQPMDIKTFVTKKRPKSHVQFAAVAAYYYGFISPQAERKETITVKDLNEASRMARGYGVSGTRIVLHQAVKQGYFNRVGRGTFKLNQVGESLVAMTLPGENGGATPRRGKKKNKRSRRGKANKA